MEDNDITQMQKILLETLLLLFEVRLDSNNILYRLIVGSSYDITTLVRLDAKIEL